MVCFLEVCCTKTPMTTTKAKAAKCVIKQLIVWHTYRFRARGPYEMSSACCCCFAADTRGDTGYVCFVAKISTSFAIKHWLRHTIGSPKIGEGTTKIAIVRSFSPGSTVCHKAISSNLTTNLHFMWRLVAILLVYMTARNAHTDLCGIVKKVWQNSCPLAGCCCTLSLALSRLSEIISTDGRPAHQVHTLSRPSLLSLNSKYSSQYVPGARMLYPLLSRHRSMLPHVLSGVVARAAIACAHISVPWLWMWTVGRWIIGGQNRTSVRLCACCLCVFFFCSHNFSPDACCFVSTASFAASHRTL